MPLLRKWLILVHRYLGIPLSLLFVVWFASGIVMMYTGGMPQLTPEARLSHLPDLDLSRVRLTAAEAVERAGLWSFPDSAVLLTVTDRPAWRFVWPFGAATVFADTGEVLGPLDASGGHAVASRFAGLPAERVRHVGEVTRRDQWTIQYGGEPPYHKFRVDDGAGSELYVSPRSAEVTMHTTRRSRALAWAGAIPHWFYLSALRRDASLWTDVVVWCATLGCVVAVLGLLLGVTQFRWRRPRRGLPLDGGQQPAAGGRIPYTGWMRWHYLTGAVFGLFTLTWVFSGLLSMEPYAWTRAHGLELPPDTFTGGPIDLARYEAIGDGGWERLAGGRGLREVELRRILDEPYFVVRLAPAGAEANRLLVAAETLAVRDEPFGTEALLARVTAAAPGAPLVEAALLQEYDAYYYSRAGRTPLPVLRVKLADPGETWLYIDPALSRLLASVHRLNRTERWLFNGLHSLDFAFWYDRRPLWDAGVIALSAGGLASSGIGLWVGFRRLRRALVRREEAPR